MDDAMLRVTVVPTESIAEGRTFASFDDEMRRHHLTHYAAALPFAEYVDAYRHGYYLGRGHRYRGRSWEAAEADVRADWEARFPDVPWERVGVAVQGAWDLVRGAG